MGSCTSPRPSSARPTFHAGITRTNVAGLVQRAGSGQSGRVRRFTYVSSSTVYQGLKQGPYREDTPLPAGEPVVPSKRFKKAGEIFIALHDADRLGLSPAIVRPRAVYGPMYYSMTNLPSLPGPCRGQRAPRPTTARPGGALRRGRQRLHQREGLRRASAHRAPGGHAAAPRLQRRQRQGSDRASPGRRGAVGGARRADRGTARQEPDRDPPHNYLDLSRAREDFGWEPKLPIEKGLPDYIEWLRVAPAVGDPRPGECSPAAGVVHGGRSRSLDGIGGLRALRPASTGARWKNRRRCRPPSGTSRPRETRELLRDHVHGARPLRVLVGEVRGPHHAIDADAVAQLDAHLVGAGSPRSSARGCTRWAGGQRRQAQQLLRPARWRS